MVYLTVLPAGKSRSREHYAGWALLRYELGELGLINPSESVDELMARAQIGSRGKPYLPGGPEFSISHSRGVAGCAVDSGPVGLDIERVREFTPGMRGKICTQGELLLTGGDDFLLTQLWTCKESYMKLTGLGFAQGLHETEFSALGDRPRLSGREEARFSSALLERRGESFWLTLCLAGEAELQIKWIDYAGL